MTAEDFLDNHKNRILRIKFPEFSVYEFYSGLLEIRFSEIMSNSPDIEIGSLVIPEMTVITEYMNLKNHMQETVTLEIGLEQKRLDVSDEIQIIQKNFDSENLIFARDASGCWIVADGNLLYSVWFDLNHIMQMNSVFESKQQIFGILIQEERVDISANGNVTNHYGVIYLLHQNSVTNIAFTGMTAFGTLHRGVLFSQKESEITITDSLHHAVISDMTKQAEHISLNEMTLCRLGVPYVKQTEKLDIRYARYYNKQRKLCRKALSAEVVIFSPVSYGEFIITETISQDEETTEMLCYGILGQVVGKNAENFFRHLHFATAENFAELYFNFIDWLNQNGISITAKNQEFLNLKNIPVIEPDWNTADFNGITAGEVLKEFAMLEGGNARMNHDNQLEIGWCETEPVLTVSSDNLSSMRIGTERLTPATGMKFLNPDSENVIQTELEYDRLFLKNVTHENAYTEVFQKIISNFGTNLHLPFSAEMLTGASPFLRAGDCIRLVNRSGAVIHVPVFTQDITAFPFLESRISVPENTSWKTTPADFSIFILDKIIVQNWTKFIIYGEPPDTSDMIVIAVLKNGNQFFVSNHLYHVTVEEITDSGKVKMTITFLDKSQSALIPVYYALYTNNGRPMTSDNHALFAVKRRSESL